MPVFLILGTLSGFLSVAIGAFGAHGLKDYFAANDPKLHANYLTAVQYQMYHSLALIAVFILLRHFPDNRMLSLSGWLFAVGILIFSGSLYAYSLTGVKVWGAITPIGGLSFLSAWVLLLIVGFKLR